MNEEHSRILGKIKSHLDKKHGTWDRFQHVLSYKDIWEILGEVEKQNRKLKGIKLLDKKI